MPARVVLKGGVGIVIRALLLAALTLDLAAQEKPKEPGRTLRGHAETVYAVAFSPDGSLLVTGSFDNTMKLWRVQDVAEVGTLAGHGGKLLSIAFSPDGRAILSGSEDKTLKLWNAPVSGPGKLTGHEGQVRTLVISPDGRWLASGGEDRTVRVWNRASGKEELKMEGLGGPSLALSFSPDGLLLAGGLGDGTVRVWAMPAPPPPQPKAPARQGQEIVKAGEPWRYHKGAGAPPAEWAKPGSDESKWSSGESGFGYSSNPAELATVKTQLPDMAGGYLSLYIRKGFRVVDPKMVEAMSLRILYDDAFVAYLNGAEVGRDNVEGSPPGHEKAASQSGEPVEKTLDLTPHLGKLIAGDNVIALQGHNSSSASSDFVLTPVLSALLKAEPSSEEKPKALEVTKPGSEWKKLEGLGGPAMAVAFSPDGKRIATGVEAGVVWVHSLGDGAEVAKLEGHQGAVRGLGFLEEGTLASAGADKAIRIWSLAEKKEVRSLVGHQGPVTALALRSDRKLLASAAEDKTVRLWDPGGKETLSIPHEGVALAVAFSPDGKEVVSGSVDKALRIFSAADGKALGSFSHAAEVRAVAVSPDGRYYSAGPGNEILDWRPPTLSAVRTLSGHGDIVHSVAFSPDGQTAASGSADKTVRLWSLADGKEVRSINAHGASVYCVAFSPDGKMVASGGFDKLVKVWNAADGAEIKKLEGHEEGVFCLTFVDADTILSGSSDRSIRKWSIKEGKTVQTLSGHPGWISDLRLVPGKPRAISVDYGGNLMVWDLEKGQSLFSQKLPAIVHGLDLSRDTRWVATANSDSSSFLFESPPAVR